VDTKSEAQVTTFIPLNAESVRVTELGWVKIGRTDIHGDTVPLGDLLVADLRLLRCDPCN
ncbi:uncharacterized protein METZ01_LOCUS71109, partial [marine metagenome]